jgi:hypothetical protein
MSIPKIVIKGNRQVGVGSTGLEDHFVLKDSFELGASTRGISDNHIVDLDNGELLELKFDDGVNWFCNAQTLEDMFPEAVSPKRSADEVFVMPGNVNNIAAERGIVGDVILKAVNVFTKNTIPKKIKELAESLEKKQLENLSGLYFLDKDFKMKSYTASDTDKPWLIFLHGTNSSTRGSFGELVGTKLWDFLFTEYQGRVLAFQHETLSKSPLQNVLDLVKQLPTYANLHLISHSRGGLVGDVLARFCNNNENYLGFDDNELDYFKKLNRTADIKAIEDIRKALSNKKMAVGKFIRVACPASGTTLASKRMDHFFNMTLNLAGLAGGIIASPVYSSFKTLAAAVVECKNDVDSLPGVEAMNPDSAFIKVLNSPQTNIVLDSPLAIISGNCKTGFNLKALLIIASRLFYTHNNDLVVNTSAMYRGATREAGQVQYFFSEGSDVDHLHYFKNAVTQMALLNALKAPDKTLIPDFILLQKGAAGLDRNAVLKLDGGQVFSNTVTGNRPIVVLLPGIMGSNLTASDKVVWINYLRFLSGELTKIEIKSPGISAPSLVKTSYEKLVKYLQQSYDVVTFAFDWRLSLNASAKIFKTKIEELLTYKQPIKLIGHSMGGVLVRDFMVTQPETWEKLNHSPGFKLVFLGSPLGGSYRIPFVLLGNDAIIGKISKLDIFHSKKELLGIFSKFPGLLSLLPFAKEGGRDFAKSQTWETLREALGDKTWPIPSEKDLKEFGAYRDTVVSTIKEEDFANAVYIAGRDKATPYSYRVDDTPQGKELVYISTGEGDQSVTWETGIPKKLAYDNKVYYVNVSHGALSNDATLFSGIAEIISTGSTNQFSKTRPSVRSTEKLFKTPVPEDQDLSPEAVQDTILGMSSAPAVVERYTRKLQVTIGNGDLSYASFPLLTGHFLHDGITSAESYVDWRLDYALSDRHKLGIYPGEIGSSEIFLQKKKSFKGAIIIGLGMQSSFTAYQLTQTVQQGVCKYLLDTNKKHVTKAGVLGLSSLLIGSGYGGLQVENAVRAIIQGVQNANEKIEKLKGSNANIIEVLQFVENYEDAVLNCFYSLNRIVREDEQNFNIEINKKIQTLPGNRKRIVMSVGENWWNRITVRVAENIDSRSNTTAFVFSASTGAARDLERTLFISPKIVENILDEMSTQNMWSKDLAKTIFELLVPNDFKEQLKRRSNASWVVDDFTAGYPWELLQDSVNDARPLCVNAGMIRQLSMKDTPFLISTVSTNNALIVGDPLLSGFVSQLPGAYAEAEMVAAKMKEYDFDTVVSLNEKSSSIIKKLFSQEYKIMHLAGHGLYNFADPSRSGMVIGNEVFLTTAEIAQMSAVPEFVFVNCCFLGKTVGADEALSAKRYQLAASIGVQLMRNGVKAVIVAGWAIGDGAALEFAKHFYDSMFGGDTFGEAVKKARACCYENFPEQNTWGAYQCYGDPYYKFDMRKSSAESKSDYVIAEEAVIDMNNLYNDLSMGTMDDDEVMEKVNGYAEKADRAEIRNAAITEKEGFIFAELLEYDRALEKFNKLMAMEQASFYVSTLEAFCNTKAKKIARDTMLKMMAPSEAMAAMELVIAELTSLLHISPTAERNSLLGSTEKRFAQVSSTQAQKTQHLASAAYHYQLAATACKKKERLYPLTNWYTCEALLVLKGKHKWGDTTGSGNKKYKIPSLARALDELAILKTETENSSETLFSYSEKITLANIKLCEILVQPKNATEDNLDQLLQEYRMVFASIGSKAKKSREVEQLDFIIAMLPVSKTGEAAKLKKRLSKLRDDVFALV